MEPNEEQVSTFLNQILGQVFETLSQNDSFDDATLLRLRKLADSNELGDFEKVVSALRVVAEN